MKFLGKDVVRYLGRVLQYAPVAIAFFFALSFWRKGFTVGAIALEDMNDDKPHVIAREIGAQQEVTDRRCFHAQYPPIFIE